MRKGKKFEDRILNALRRYGFAYKFRDYAVNPNGAYKIAVPSDILFIFNGKTMFLECKEFKGKRFYKNKIRDAQWKYAEQITKEKIDYFFLIHSVDAGKIFVVKYFDIAVDFTVNKSLTIEYLMKYHHIEDKRIGKNLIDILLSGLNF